MPHKHPAGIAFSRSMDQLDAVLETAVLIAFVDGYLHRAEVKIIKEAFARITNKEAVLYGSVLSLLDQKCIGLLNNEIDIKSALKKVEEIKDQDIKQFAQQLFVEIVDADGEVDEAEKQLLDLIFQYL